MNFFGYKTLDEKIEEWKSNLDLLDDYELGCLNVYLTTIDLNGKPNDEILKRLLDIKEAEMNKRFPLDENGNRIQLSQEDVIRNLLKDLIKHRKALNEFHEKSRNSVINQTILLIALIGITLFNLFFV